MRVAIASQLASMAVLMGQMDQARLKVAYSELSEEYAKCPVTIVVEPEPINKADMRPRQTHPTNPKKSYRGRRGR